MKLLFGLVLAIASLDAAVIAFTTPVVHHVSLVKLVPSSRASWSPATPSVTQKSPALRMSAEAINPEDVPADDSSASSASGGTATIPNEIFNLVKSIVGAGVLSLPAGIAAFGDAPSAVWPAVALIAGIGGLSGYAFSLIGRVCSYTGATSYRDAWSDSVGPDSSWIPAVSCTFKTTAAVLAYSMILADTSTSLLATAGIASTRTQSLLGVTSLVLLPLCWLKNLSSLAPFSLLGSLGMVYTAFAMAVRYFGPAYKKGGKYLADVPASLRPSFGTNGAASVFSPKSFILICMLSTAFMAHFNAPKFYTELKDNTIKRYNTVVSASFGISIALFAAIAGMGFLTFGAASSGLILNNYANADSLMSLSRIAVLVSLVFSYPLVFVGVRDGFMDLLNIKDRSNSKLNSLTVGLLAGVTGLALKVQDLSFVLAFGGATLGNALIYIYPALMFRAAVKKMKEPSEGLKKEVNFALGTAALGLGLGITGAKMAIKSLMS